jgi:hypothetical protein
MVGGTLALYYGDTDLAAQGNRPGAGLLRVPDLVRSALDFVTLGDPYQITLYAFGALVAPLYCARRRRDLLPIVLTLLVIEVVSIPLLTKVLQWKRYYFHPRHALFLLPGLELLAALGLTAACSWIASWVPGLRTSGVRRGAIGIAAVLVVLWIRVPMVRAFMTQPHGYFLWTKTERDFKTLARDLRTRTMFYRPNEKYLLIVDRIGAGYLANPTLARYLRWYSIEHRVVLLSTTAILSALENLEHGCDGSCRGRPGQEVARALYLASPFELAAAKLRLLGLGPSFGSWPGVVRDAGVLLYPESSRLPDVSNANVSPYMGAIVAEPRWEEP